MLPGRRAALIILVVALAVLTAWQPAVAQVINLSPAPGGIPLSNAGGGGKTWQASFGAMNALGVGTPAPGINVIPLSNGALYYTHYLITVTGLGTHSAVITGVVSNNFAHPLALVMESCPAFLACASATDFSVMSTNAGAPTTIVGAPGLPNNSVVTAGLAIFVPDNNGAGAFSGTDSARLKFTARDLTNNQTDTVELRLENPNESLQSALQLTLATATGGLTVNPGADFSLNFGNVNSLGIGPAPGLTTLPVAGGIIYSTPYLLQPAFSGFASTTGTLSVFVSTDFVNSAALQLNSATNSAGPYTAISKSAATATRITSAATNRVSLTEFLGLFVSRANGPAAFAGTDSATLTFTLTVP
jgi:hypothetical protein